MSELFCGWYSFAARARAICRTGWKEDAGWAGGTGGLVWACSAAETAKPNQWIVTPANINPANQKKCDPVSLAKPIFCSRNRLGIPVRGSSSLLVLCQAYDN